MSHLYRDMLNGKHRPRGILLLPKARTVDRTEVGGSAAGAASAGKPWGGLNFGARAGCRNVGAGFAASGLRAPASSAALVSLSLPSRLPPPSDHQNTASCSPSSCCFARRSQICSFSAPSSCCRRGFGGMSGGSSLWPLRAGFGRWNVPFIGDAKRLYSKRTKEEEGSFFATSRIQRTC